MRRTVAVQKETPREELDIMDAFFVLAKQAQSTLNDVAHSALPNAPQLPYVERRHRMRRLVASVRNVPGHRPRPVVARSTRATRAPDCRPL
jgi:hypothetical protein